MTHSYLPLPSFLGSGKILKPYVLERRKVHESMSW